MMYDSKVPVNRLQQRLDTTKQNEFRVEYKNRTWGLIIKVWDGDSLNTPDLPANIKRMIERYPGLLIADVLCLNPLVYITAPFMRSEQEIYQTYGNHWNLERTMCAIYTQGHDISTAEIEPAYAYGRKHVSLKQSAEIADIGGIVNG